MVKGLQQEPNIIAQMIEYGDICSGTRVSGESKEDIKSNISLLFSIQRNELNYIPHPLLRDYSDGDAIRIELPEGDRESQIKSFMEFHAHKVAQIKKS